MDKMSDVITLSSDEDEYTVPAKKIKLNGAGNLHTSIYGFDKEHKAQNPKKAQIDKVQKAPIICLDGNEEINNLPRNVDTINVSDDILIIEDNTAENLNKSSNVSRLVDKEERDSESLVTLLKYETVDAQEVVSSDDDDREKSETSKNGIIDSESSNMENSETLNSTERELCKAVQPECSSTRDTDATGSEDSTAHKLMEDYLQTCANAIKSSKYEEKLLAKFEKIRNCFTACRNIHQDKDFHELLQNEANSAKLSPANAVISFKKILTYIEDQKDGPGVEVPEGHIKKLKKLEKFIKIVLKRLKILENKEINFDEENDSTYIQIDRYSQRLNKAYKKYCQLLNRNPQAGRLVNRVTFVHSQYPEINQAVTKSYKHNKFPTYQDVEKCVRKCVSEHNLKLSECEIKVESKECFTKMGNLLQSLRRKELYEAHCSYLGNDDPAKNDQELDAKLRTSKDEGDKKLKAVIDKYVQLQESNVEVELSNDSDDSNYKDSDDDD